jgi:hypothetical protein
MTLKAILGATIAGAAGYVLLRAARFGGEDTEAKIVYVSEPAKQKTNNAGTIAGLFNLALGIADSANNGRVIFNAKPGAVAGGGDSLPDVIRASYSANSGRPDFAKFEQTYSLPPGYLARTAQIESGGNPSAKNPRSSAGGLFQFIDSTARQYGLVDRYDAGQATDAASRLASDNARQLRGALGREPTAAELYLAHQQGGTGARRLLANPTARASDVVGSDAVRLNGGTASMSAGDFAGLWINKFNRDF